MKHLKLLVYLVCAMLIGSASSAFADTITYSLSTGFCSGGCGTSPFGTVTATDIGAGEVQVNVTLSTGVNFAKTGAGAMQALLFDLNGAPTLTDYTDVSSNQPIVLAGTAAGSIMADGSGTWQYAVGCPSCGGGVSAPQLLSPITFDISATGLSTASFVQNPNGLYFAADIIGTTGNTGDVGAPTATPVATAPEPTSIFLLGSGLVGLGLLRKRTRKN